MYLQIYMQRLRKLSLPCDAKIAFSKSFVSLSAFSPSKASEESHNCPAENRHFILSLLNKYPSTRQVIQQIHSKLITTGSLHHVINARIQIINTLLRHYSVGQFPEEALCLYKYVERIVSSFRFDSFTYLYIIKACANLNQIITGIQVHTRVVKAGFDFQVYVGTALLNMYVECGLLFDAKKLFDEIPDRNSATWNVMITGLVKWGELEAAWGLFDDMPNRNIISWTGMIDGCTRMEKYDEAFHLFRRMTMIEGIIPTEVTFLAIFPAIVNRGDLKNCKAIHAYGHKMGLDVGDVRFTNCLIDTYAKCGCINSALRVFEELSEGKRNLVSWTSIISGFAMHGMAKEAVENFGMMESIGLRPNHITFLSVLGACSHGGLVAEGLEFFRKMNDDYQLLPGIKHYGCVIDMLGRGGRLREAEEIAFRIPDEIDNVVIWRTLLGACSLHGNVEMAEHVARRIQEMERGYGGDYVLMSNILTGLGKFDDAEKVRTSMDAREIFKTPGLSLG